MMGESGGSHINNVHGNSVAESQGLRSADDYYKKSSGLYSNGICYCVCRVLWKWVSGR